MAGGNKMTHEIELAEVGKLADGEILAESIRQWRSDCQAGQFKIGATTVGGRVDRVDRHPDGSYELIDYKTGAAKSAAELADDLQIALYRYAAREAWDIEAADGAYWYVLDDEKVPAGGEPGALARVERTVAEVAAGITGQDFEPRPSFEVCSWCDYRLICPASEA